MTDLWSFLLQTLNASGVAVLLLVVKALLTDKLPPKWQFSVWGVLGAVLLIPAGWNNRFALVNWQYPVELLKTAVGNADHTRVLFPVPVLQRVPETLTQWLFAVYVVGVVVHLAKYVISYLRLRFALRKGATASDAVCQRVETLAARLCVKPCRVITVAGLSGAFVCGVCRPVLVLSDADDCDDKILMHELMHMKSKDTFWSIVIAVLRSLHWCNPLLVYCAVRAVNDMESRCDQAVLERLDGEERRQYGHILLSMVNERFAKTPGTTCVNNGAKHIRRRIEAIARFKKYPVGMRLVSVCLLLMMGLTAVIGERVTLPGKIKQAYAITSFASYASVSCTTYAGAFDAYAKAVLTQNGYCRLISAPQEVRAQLQTEMRNNYMNGVFSVWDSGVSDDPDVQGGYYIYNLRKIEENVYEGLLVITLQTPYTDPETQEKMKTLAFQTVRVQKENGRFVALALDAFSTVHTRDTDISWGCEDLPVTVYGTTHENWTAEVITQNFYTVESNVQMQSNAFGFADTVTYDVTPQPNTQFSKAGQMHRKRVYHNGTQEQRDAISVISLSVSPVYPGETPPEELTEAAGDYVSGSNSRGESWSSHSAEPGWGPYMELGGGGGSLMPEDEPEKPAYYAARLSTNDGFKVQLQLVEQKGENP